MRLTLLSGFRSLLQQQIHTAGESVRLGVEGSHAHREVTRRFLPEGGQPCRDLDGSSEEEGLGLRHQAQRTLSLPGQTLCNKITV